MEEEKEVYSLWGKINTNSLLKAHKELLSADRNEKKAMGIDQESAKKFDSNGKPQENIQKVLQELKEGEYKPLPVKRVMIPKGNGKERPLGLPSYRDKVIQKALVNILNPIYEELFIDNSYGFREKRSCHKAISKVDEIINRMGKKKEVYIVVVDIKGYFDNINHKILLNLMRRVIKDKKIITLIYKILKAGYVEKGVYYKSIKGTPQGGIISPLLANIYLHYVVDTWVYRYANSKGLGDVELIRYADDFIIICNDKEEAYKMKVALKRRIRKYRLELSKEKTRIVHLKDNKTYIEENSISFLGFQIYRSGNGIYINTAIKKQETKIEDILSSVKSIIVDTQEIGKGHSIRYIITMTNSILLGIYEYYGYVSNIEWIERVYKSVVDTVSDTLREDDKYTQRDVLLVTSSLKWYNPSKLRNIHDKEKNTK